MQKALNIIIQYIKDDFQNYFSIVMFRGTPCMLNECAQIDCQELDNLFGCTNIQDTGCLKKHGN